MLIGRNTNLDKVNEDGETALHVASSAGHGKVVELLLAAGADMDVKNKVSDYAAVFQTEMLIISIHTMIIRMDEQQFLLHF